ncbi:cytochrome P450 [Umezawaea sp. Da 62-37]|uniref:cytochrome P450 family protein n=1 Tax=Umezawaea sp. Da 62-37 TaxID=3075927 RepID=UPI0028F73182|nr:cytochrome P450 [Umezawaea sp. Da 62-37]WNV85838.1 cytochrome P450 [Umezawaea sp. Da 62-37]
MEAEQSTGDPAGVPAPLATDLDGGCPMDVETSQGVGPARRGRLTSGIEAWLVTRYDEVDAALVDPRLVLSAPDVEADLVARGELPQRFAGQFQRARRSLLSTDPPEHTRLRGLVASSFTARRVEALRPRAERICVDLATALGEESGVVDLVDSYALPLPVLMICELLGVPPEDRETFRGWTNAIVFDQGDGPAVARYRAASASLDDYFGALVEHKRDHPADDLTSALVAAHDGGTSLDAAELRTMLALLLVAGHETTVNLIGSSVLTLLRSPGQFTALRAHPELMASAVEECLRHVGPVGFSSLRFTTADIELGEVTIPAGQAVALGLWAADHDRRRFPDPADFDIARSDNRHLAFGRGAHFCVGANLARMEAQVAVRTLR